MSLVSTHFISNGGESIPGLKNLKQGQREKYIPWNRYYNPKSFRTLRAPKTSLVTSEANGTASENKRKIKAILSNSEAPVKP